MWEVRAGNGVFEAVFFWGWSRRLKRRLKWLRRLFDYISVIPPPLAALQMWNTHLRNPPTMTASLMELKLGHPPRTSNIVSAREVKFIRGVRRGGVKGDPREVLEI